MFCVYFLVPLLVSRLHISLAAEIESNDTYCPTWTKYDSITSDCECGDFVNNMIHCNAVSKEVDILDCYCMSYDSDMNLTVVGFSPYACDVEHGSIYKVPSFPELLDSVICGHQNRTGQMCGSCQEGYAPPVYSYSLACVECSDYQYNWLKYIAVGYLPLTVFYFIVIFFRVNIISPSMNVYVMICQIVGTPLILSLIEEYAVKTGIALILLFGFWNLDFFRALYKPFCLHPNMTTLQALTLDYAIAVYPLVLIVLTYILVKLHDNYSLVVWLWTPFRRCFFYFRKEWNLSDSLIGAFCTFLLLSYVKILNVSLGLLAPVVLHDINGNALKERYLLYDGTVQWFGQQHLPFALLAIVMCLFFNILPLLLLVFYPCGCFQKCLNQLKLSSHVLHIFMDIFQGHYKTNCRCAAALYLTVRIGNTILLSIGHTKHLYFAAIGSLLTVVAIIMAVLRPYKRMAYSILDVVLLFIVANFAPTFGLLLYVHENVVAADHGVTLYNILSILLFFGFSIPSMYGVVYLAYHVLPKSFLQQIKRLFARLRYKRNRLDICSTAEPFRFSPPDIQQYQYDSAAEHTLLISSIHQ